MPTPDRSCRPPGIELSGSLIDASSIAADPYGLATATLVGRHEFDAAVAVLVVVPVDERRHPLRGLVFGGKWLAEVFRPILHNFEQRFRVGVVVAGSRP